MGRARGRNAATGSGGFTSVLGARRGRPRTSDLNAEHARNLIADVGHGRLAEALAVLGTRRRETSAQLIHQAVCEHLAASASADAPSREISSLLDAACLVPKSAETLFYLVPENGEQSTLIHICPRADAELEGQRWRDTFNEGSLKTACGRTLKSSFTPKQGMNRALRGAFAEPSCDPTYPIYGLTPCPDCARVAGGSPEAVESAQDAELPVSETAAVVAETARQIGVILDEHLQARPAVDERRLTNDTKDARRSAMRAVVTARLQAGGEGALRELVSDHAYDKLNKTLRAQKHPLADNLLSLVTEETYEEAFYTFFEGVSPHTFRIPFFRDVVNNANFTLVPVKKRGIFRKR